jgi:AcrR family transcriptional regulator
VKVTPGTDRRAAIGDAAIAIVARDGLRALTHRAIDRELGLPAGSTSYYVRTRRQLIEAIVHRLAARTRADLNKADLNRTDNNKADQNKADLNKEELAKQLAGLIERMASRPDDHRVRWALAVDLAGDPELHGRLTYASPVRTAFLAGAADRLRAIGVAEPERHAPALVMLTDALLFDRLAGSGVDPAARPDAEATLTAFLAGLERTEKGSGKVGG